MPTLARVEIPHLSGLPEDTIVNQFVLGAGAPKLTVANMDAAADAIAGFWDDDEAVGQALPLRSYYSDVALLSNAVVKFYDIEGHLDGSNFGSPYGVRDLDINDVTTGAVNLPSEVQFVLTIEASGRSTAEVTVPGGVPGPEGDTRPRSRRTGRLYLGPLGSNALVQAEGSELPRPSDTFRTDVLTAAQQLATDLLTIGDTEWHLWSRADAAVRTLEAFSADNAFDTQRRRGEKATNRVRVVAP